MTDDAQTRAPTGQPKPGACLDIDLDRSVAEVLFERFERFGDRPAIIDDAGAMAYGALKAKADRIARAIRCHNETGGAAAIILAGHGRPFIMAMLGAIRAGFICVPLDPEGPAERNKSIASDVGPALFLADAANFDRAKQLAGGHMPAVNIDDLVSSPSGLDGALPASTNECFGIYYTSGSTGTPKGVMHSHRGVLHLVRAFIADLEIVSEDRFLLPIHGSYMASIKLLFGALARGAVLCPFDPRRESAAAMADLINARSISIVFFVASVFRELMTKLPETVTFPTARTLILGGEAAYGSDVALWRKRFPADGVFVSFLGSTETHTYCRNFIRADSEIGDGPLPAGRPVEGKTVHIWDERNQPVAPGEVGEILVESRYLALGYWNRPTMTEAAFVASGSSRDAAVVYRTGDFGWMAPDGRLHVVGRKDNAHKVLGTRVEIAEVESALMSIEGVDHAAVTVRRNDRVHVRVEAYLVPRAGALSRESVRAALVNTLPQQMIPSKFTWLDRLPTLANGKIDRRALEDIGTAPARQATEPVAWSDPIEREIAEIFETVLGKAPGRIDEDFFEIGGDSLQAVELLLHIEKRFGHALPHSVLLEAGTVAALARAVTEDRPMDCLVAFRAVGSRPPFFLVHPRGGQVLQYANIARHLDDDQPFYGFQASGIDDKSALHESVEDLASHYIEAMKSVAPEGPYHIGGYSFGGLVALEMAQRLRQAGEPVGQLILIDTSARDGRLRAPVGLWLKRHVGRLSRMPLRDALPYLKERLINASVFLRRAVPGRQNDWQDKIGNIGAPLSLNRIETLHALAARRYQPRAYDGPALHIRGIPNAWAHPSTHEGWKDIFGPRLDIRSLDATHEDLVREPRATEVAAIIQESLDRASRDTETNSS